MLTSALATLLLLTAGQIDLSPGSSVTCRIVGRSADRSQHAFYEHVEEAGAHTRARFVVVDAQQGRVVFAHTCPRHDKDCDALAIVKAQAQPWMEQLEVKEDGAYRFSVEAGERQQPRRVTFPDPRGRTFGLEVRRSPDRACGMLPDRRPLSRFTLAAVVDDEDVALPGVATDLGCATHAYLDEVQAWGRTFAANIGVVTGRPETTGFRFVYAKRARVANDPPGDDELNPPVETREVWSPSGLGIRGPRADFGASRGDELTVAFTHWKRSTWTGCHRVGASTQMPIDDERAPTSLLERIRFRSRDNDSEPFVEFSRGGASAVKEFSGSPNMQFQAVLEGALESLPACVNPATAQQCPRREQRPIQLVVAHADAAGDYVHDAELAAPLAADLERECFTVQPAPFEGALSLAALQAQAASTEDGDDAAFALVTRPAPARSGAPAPSAKTTLTIAMRDRAGWRPGLFDVPVRRRFDPAMVGRGVAAIVTEELTGFRAGFLRPGLPIGGIWTPIVPAVTLQSVDEHWALRGQLTLDALTHRLAPAIARCGAPNQAGAAYDATLEVDAAARIRSVRFDGAASPADETCVRRALQREGAGVFATAPSPRHRATARIHVAWP